MCAVYVAADRTLATSIAECVPVAIADGQTLQLSCNPAKYFVQANDFCPLAFRAVFPCDTGRKDVAFCESGYHFLCAAHDVLRETFKCPVAVIPFSLKYAVNEVRYATEDNWHMGTPLGVWGGECTCPDGRVYTAGDRGNLCGSTNCFGGTEGRCIQAQGPWAFREVHCGRLPTPFDSADLVLENQQSAAGKWGGTCTCPSGNVYVVADHKDGCQTLSCEGG